MFQVKLSVFLMYLRYVGLVISLVIVLLYVLTNALSIYSNFWLSEWSNDRPINGTFDTSLRDLRLGIYGALGFGQGKVNSRTCFWHSYQICGGKLEIEWVLRLCNSYDFLTH